MLKNQSSTPAKLTKRSFYFLLLGGVAAGILVLAIFWLAFFARQPAASTPPALRYTLLGDPAWVENRLWQEDLVTRQISHPDWTLNFVLPSSALTSNEATPSFYLDKKLDDFVLTWSQHVLRRQWQQLWASAYPPKSSDFTFLEVSSRLNSWTRDLNLRQLHLETVNFYLPLEVGTSTLQTSQITAVWTIRHADQSTELVTTSLVVNCDPAASCAWEFNFASLPLFES